MKKILILGSSLFRDVISHAEGDFKLMAYFFRPSLALLSSHSSRLLSLEHILSESIYDMIFMDFMDEGYPLFEKSSGEIDALFSRNATDCEEGSVIPALSTKQFQRWCLGLERFVSVVKKLNILDKVKINKVYWSTTMTEDVGSHQWQQTQIANECLNQLYIEMEKYFPPQSFIIHHQTLDIEYENKKYLLNHKTPLHMRFLEGIRRDMNEGGVLKVFEKHMPSTSINFGPIKVTTITRNEIASHFNPIEVENFNQLDVLFKAQNMVKQIATDGYLTLPSITSNKTLSCYHSFVVYFKNYLIFKNEVEIMILGQKTSMLSEVYFPLRGLMVRYFPGNESEIALIQNQLIQYLNENENRTHANHCYGVYTSYPRPYHYFYDVISSLWFIMRQENAQVLRRIVSIGSNYIPEGYLGNFEKEHQFSDAASLNDFLLLNHFFIIRLGGRHDGVSRNTLNIQVDQHIIKNILPNHRFNPQQQYILKRLASPEKKEFKLWISLCKEKRAWQERLEGIKLCVDLLMERYGKVILVVDGMTRTISESTERYRLEPHIHSEIAELQLFIKRLPSSVEIINLIGEEALFKIAVAQKIDFFLTNFQTDSMYPAKFGKKPGIAHGSTMTNPSKHGHPLTTFVPNEHVTDVFPPEENAAKVKDPGKISYSIKPQIIGEMLIEILNNHTVMS